MPPSDDISPLDQEALTAIFHRLCAALYASLPQLWRCARVEKSDGSYGSPLVLIVPSPTEDRDREIVILVDDVATPTLEFGPSHVHEDNDDDGIAAILDLAAAILHDELLIVEDVGAACPPRGFWIDLRDADALEEELTSPESTGSILLKSWSGAADRLVGIDSLMP